MWYFLNESVMKALLKRSHIFNPFHNLVNIHVLTRKTLRPKISKFASSTLAILFFHLIALPSSYV